jgi:hypothetical protein
MTENTQTRQPQRGLTFDDVWAMFQETDKKFHEVAEESKKTEKMFQESKASTEELKLVVKDLCKQIGGVHRSLGDLMETLMASRLWEKFPEYKFNRSFENIKLLNDKNISVAEIDILLADDEWVMAVEVKRKPVVDDVKDHIERMKVMREYKMPETKEKKLLGAIAGGVVSPEVRKYAQKCGLYVLELNGEQVSLLESPAGFVALQS